jgi:ATP-dependent RNA helicase DDX51/DBP6
VDILICTPGRLVEHIKTTPGFSLRDTEWLVIDEADRLLDHNFQDWVDVVLPALEKRDPPTAREKVLATLKERWEFKRIQKVILSATMTRDLSKLATLRLNRPTLVAIVEPKDGNDGAADPTKTNGQGAVLPTRLEESAIPVGDGSEKPIYLLHLLQEYLKISRLDEGAEDDSIFHSVLVFTSSDDNATRLGKILALLNPSLQDITATLTKSTTAAERRKLLNAVRDGKIKILISTDRASRGLDLEDLTYVVNYDMAFSVTSYVHRVGRTARAGKKGKAWTLYTDKEARWFWKTVAQGSDIQRGNREVERLRFAADFGGEELRERYQESLQKLQDAVHGREE